MSLGRTISTGFGQFIAGLSIIFIACAITVIVAVVRQDSAQVPGVFWARPVGGEGFELEFIPQFSSMFIIAFAYALAVVGIMSFRDRASAGSRRGTSGA